MKIHNYRKKNSKNILAGAMVALSLSATVIPGTSHAQLSSNPRKAVVLEAYHALIPSVTGPCRKNISKDCVGEWNYLNDDYSAYVQLKSWYGCADASVWKVANDTDGKNVCSVKTNKSPSYYSDPYGYGFSPYDTATDKVGRGGQCKHFANLITYRSGMHTRKFDDYATMAKSSNSFPLTAKNLQSVKLGDIIFNPNVHTAIVTGIVKNGSTVTGLYVVDSNFVGGNGKEVIGMHLFGAAVLNSYSVWKGTDYYKTDYK